MLLGTRSTIQQNVSLLLRFRLHYFLAPWLHPSIFLQKNYLKLLLQFPAGHMELPLTGRCALNSTRIATKLGTVGRGKCQLSVVPRFSSIRAFSAERTISKFRSNSRRGTYDNQGGAILAADGANVEIHTSSFISNAARPVCSIIVVNRIS
jgi:hypothetical protein